MSAPGTPVVAEDAKAIRVTPIRIVHQVARSTKRKIKPDSVPSSAYKRVLFITDGSERTLNPDDPFVTQRHVQETLSYYPEGLGRVKSCQPLLEAMHAHPSHTLSPHDAAHIILPKHVLGVGGAQMVSMQAYIEMAFPPEFRPTYIHLQPMCMQLMFEKLPPAPWPVSIGGLIAVLREFDPEKDGSAMITVNPLFPEGKMLGWFQRPALQDIDGPKVITTRGKFKEVAAKIYEHFWQRFPDHHVTNVVYSVEKHLLIFLNGNMDVSKLPGSIAKCFVFYYQDDVIPLPATEDLSMKRSTGPVPEATPPIIDNTVYSTIRPGVLLCTGDVPTPKKSGDGKDNSNLDTDTASEKTQIPSVFRFSTTGVLVCHKSDPSKIYMTGSRHSMSGSDRHIWQPGEHAEETFNGNGNRFGTFDQNRDIDFKGTDVCLVNIDKDVAFENVPFQHDDGTIPRLRGLVTPDTELDNVFLVPLWLNSPYTGLLDGMLAGFGLAEEIMHRQGQSREATAKSATKLMNEGRLDPAKDFIETVWMYHGNRADDKIRNGMCGSAIVDSTGMVQGFFHTYCSSGPLEGLSYSVGAQHLAEKGYRLAPENGIKPSDDPN